MSNMKCQMLKCKYIPAVAVLLLLVAVGSQAQSIAQKLEQAIQQTATDPSLKHAILSLYVVEAKTGKRVYAHNEQIGLAPASTQKLFTSAAAFELLGKEYRYTTRLGYTGAIKDGVLNGNIYVIGSGDPTLGSWRWKTTRDSLIIKNWVAAVQQAGIRRIDGLVTTNEYGFTHQAIPDGWIWQDIGNYYGAGAYSLNWRENQYDLILRSGNTIGDQVVITATRPAGGEYWRRVNELSSAARGSGDNAYIYLGLGEDRNTLVKGTIPVGEKAFSISGASPDPVSECITELALALDIAKVKSDTAPWSGRDIVNRKKEDVQGLQILATHQSPPLDSMNYWFLRRSINLYGEALVKTIAQQKTGLADTEKGVEEVRTFWAQQGIEKSAIHIIDGSGLSPQNRVTTDALVKVLQYARTRPWFHSFYTALPEYNGMKMKSGSVGGARAFAGYHTSSAGKEYTFAIIVNNYDGSSGEAVKKLYKVLDVLK
jgi:D-alanyl-D-alanine carboxypeptidase/D-alanyl-D-alanine-endopeptidase (penicillin-binding protein 4)